MSSDPNRSRVPPAAFPTRPGPRLWTVALLYALLAAGAWSLPSPAGSTPAAPSGVAPTAPAPVPAEASSPETAADGTAAPRAERPAPDPAYAALRGLRAELEELRGRYDTDLKAAEQARQAAETSARRLQDGLWLILAVAVLLATVVAAQALALRRRGKGGRRLRGHDPSAGPLHDPLTGAFNRKHCESLMEQQTQRLQGRSRDRDYKACVSLIALDVDRFKQINDTHGHAAGDVVLVEVAHRLQGLLREKDAVVRWGGEEFVLLLPGTPPEGLLVVAERLLAAIASTPIAITGAALRVTASAGCVTWPFFAGQSWQDALHVADLALYRAKASGRNRAISVNTVMPTADFERLRHDLAAAEAAGDIELRVIPGPIGEAPVPSEV